MPFRWWRCRRSPSWRARSAGCGRSIVTAAPCRPRPISAMNCACAEFPTRRSTGWTCPAGAWPSTAPSRSARIPSPISRGASSATACAAKRSLRCMVWRNARGGGALGAAIPRGRSARSGGAEPAGGEEADALRFVACGRPLPGHQIRVVDATGREVGERVEGRLEFKGPSATAGYFRNPEQNRRMFHEDWLDSGDYAYFAAGDVYLTGRAKDIIIRAGRNIYPHELEEAVGNVPGVRKGCVAVFGSPDLVSGTERLVVMAETRETESSRREELRSRVSALTLDILGTPADDIVLAPLHSVLKTSSGKIRRAACRELYERGAAPERAVWWQVVRLAWAGLLPQLRRGSRVIADLLYAAWVWALFWLMAPLTWLGGALLPRPVGGWGASRIRARPYARLTGTPLAVHGLE